ncbi:MAG TPA: ATP-binding protein [Pyrinomonadaceae bacterium]|jgi:nitrogen fixation/metabolism regulation signal transduction histidine kinase
MREEHEQPGETASGAEQAARRRSAPWFFGSLVLILLATLVALQVSGLWEFVTPDNASDTLALYALSTLNFVAFVIFSFIFVRSLLKLRSERRAHELGSRIKTRLVVYFIAVSLLPIAGMAVFSYLFFNRTLEKWFSSLPEGVVQQAREVKANESRNQARNFREIALVAHRALSSTEAGADPKTTLDELVERGDLSLLALRGGEELQPVVSARGLAPGQVEALVGGVGAATAGEARQGELSAGGKVFDVMRLPVGERSELVAARERRNDPRVAELVQSSQTFDNFKRRQRKVRLLGLSTLGLLTMLLLFAATWAAIHVARGIGTPIRTLAEAAGEVARGNLAHRVSVTGDDELAVLADTFNSMTAQLEENRSHIDANSDALRETNLALDERRAYIETVLESLSTGVVSLDADDRLTTINAAALQMLRLDAPPAAGTPLAGIVNAEDRPVLERVLARARRTGRAAWQMELTRGAAQADGGGDSGGGGDVVPVALTATAFGAQPESASRGVVLVIEDLTELLAAQRAAAWSEVARRMAHEIKNPLTPIQLSAERIARNFTRARAGEDGGAQILDVGGNGREADDRVARIVEECTQTITREVGSLKAMVDEFSRFSRLPRARLEAAHLNEVVRQAVALYEDRLADVRLDVLLAHALPPAHLDAEQMRRALVNLIDNALEATAHAEGESRITVATGHDPARGLLLLEIADTGHGIAREDFAHLFQPYFSTRGRGTGLGLAIVQHIINDHGGRIRAEQNRPRGAKFLVELPVADETQRSEVRGQRSGEEGLASSL